MRALVLLLPLAVAFAGDTAPLEDAAKQWASESPDVRDIASRTVAVELRRQLAPILDAMRSDDPEVRRRARAALESLLPPRPPEPEPQEQQQWQGRVLIFNNAGVGGAAGAPQALRVILNAQGQAVLVQDQGEAQQLKAKGIAGQPVDDPVMREQLCLAEGRGFAVTAVDAGSDAERLGIKARDILLSMDGHPVKQGGEVLKALAAPKPEIHLLRRGKLVTLGGKEVEGEALGHPMNQGREAAGEGR